MSDFRSNGYIKKNLQLSRNVARSLCNSRASCLVYVALDAIGNESVPIQLAQCWFTGPAISNAKTNISFSNKIHGSNFIEQHSETVEIGKMLIGV